MAQEGIATLPMQQMPEESQGIGAFNPEAQQAAPEVTEKDRFDAVMTAIAQRDPQMAAKVKQLVMELNLSPTEVEQLKQVIAFLEQNKDNYPAARQSLIQQGIIEEDELPPEYSEETMVLLKMVVYATESMAQGASTPPPQQFRKGGLAQAAESLRKKGRGNDTVLAHINPAEAKMLQQMGGSGRINPNTGLPEFGFLRKIVGKVLGVADKIFGSDLTNIIVQVGGFMIGGPTGAALASAMLTYGRGGSLKDMLLNAGTAYIGGQYGPMAGAAAGAGSTLIRGGSLKDAVRQAAISGAMSYGMQNAGEYVGRGLQTAGEWWNGTQAPTPGTGLTTTTGAPTSTADVSASSIANQGGALTDTSAYGLKTNIAPTGADMGYRGLGQDMGPVNYGMTGNVGGASTSNGFGINAGTPGGYALNASGTPTLSNVGSSLMSGNVSQAGSQLWDWAKANPKTAIATGLGITALAGGFKESQPGAPGIVDRRTGTDVINADPSRYIVQNLRGVNYTPTGNIDFAAKAPGAQNPSGIQALNAPMQQVPTYSIPTDSATQTTNRQVVQPYNYNPYNFTNPYQQPLLYNQGGSAQYPRRTGQIAGPGTETSDDIPAMLSDGEFVITAKAVRGIGNGSRRAGAKKLYRMMHAMEKKAGGKV